MASQFMSVKSLSVTRSAYTTQPPETDHVGI